MSFNLLLPSFFVIGAQKSATTTIHNWLKQHQEVSLPIQKETHYFSKKDKFDKGIDWYIEQFSSNKDILLRGEIDPSYMYIKNSVKRIKQIINDRKSLKFIILLREPIDRGYSHYLMTKYRGLENLSFLDAIKEERERLSNNDKTTLNHKLMHFSYLDRGNYVEQIERFKDAFKESEFLFLKFNDIINNDNNNETYKTICDFLDLTYKEGINLQYKSNSSSSSRSNILSKLIYKDSKIKIMLNRLIYSKMIKYKTKKFLNRINKKKINSRERKILLHNIIEKLPKKFILWNNNEVRNLEKVTALNLNEWIIK